MGGKDDGLRRNAAKGEAESGAYSTVLRRPLLTFSTADKALLRTRVAESDAKKSKEKLKDMMGR